MPGYRRKVFASSLLCLLCIGMYALAFIRPASLQKQVHRLRHDVLSSGTLSQISQQYLKRHYLIKRFKADPLDVITDLQRAGPPSETPDRIYTLSEVSLAQALALEAKDPRAAADWHLFAAAKAYDALFAPDCRIYSCFDPRHESLRLFFARALGGWVINRRKLGPIEPEERLVMGETYRTGIMTGPHLRDPNAFSQLMIALETKVKEFSTRSLRRGIGISFVGWRENSKESAQDRYSPLVGLAQALSVMAFFHPSENGRREVKFGFYDSLSQESIEINGANVPLAADFTAAFAYQVSQAKLRRFNIEHTLDIQAGLGATGFYMLSPFDPDKIPLITVHGLFSSPLSWVQVTNDLLGDPEIRRHFQIWHFFYPPGLPILVSASMFRDNIDELFRTFDPARSNPKMDQAIVLAHSMGGLLTRTVVADSGETIWKKLFGKSKSELSLPLDLEEQLDKLLNFKRKEFIQRVIFVAVPHRGSQMSEDLIGRIGRSLVSLPSQLVARLEDLHSRLLDFLDPQDLEALVSPKAMNSIRGLSPHNPGIQALSQVAIARAVQFHSIIGAESKTESGEPTDGVVAYSSAHLEGAASELIVPAGHSAHTHPLAILEIERILRLHLREFEAAHPEVERTLAAAEDKGASLCSDMY